MKNDKLLGELQVCYNVCMAHRQTHCKRGHEFTPDNEMWRTRDRGYGMETTRTCRECHRIAWYRYRNSPIYDKERVNRVTKVWRDNNKDKTVNHRLKQYGLTIETYTQMAVKQSNTCLICGVPKTKKLVVDHDHETGIVRGLLCASCNMQLGWYEKNIIKIKEYLNEVERYK